ncbi:MAG: hypothetical protein ABIO46_10915 [Chitinophagales bacterium]
MANYSIRITGIVNGVLQLSDNGTTNVDPGDTVTWSISPNSGVASITGIVDNSTVDVFNPDPASQGNGSWMGTVNPNIARGSLETYTINYTSSANEVCSFDPKIQVNR